ncbi:MAG: hypothetical protein ACI4CC_01530 [Lachnospiraceae bacterium]
MTMLTVCHDNMTAVSFPTISNAEDAYKVGCRYIESMSTFPNNLVLGLNGDTSVIHVIKRGTFVDKDGNRKPSPHCVQDESEGFQNHTWNNNHKKTVLTCVNFTEDKTTGETANNYKFYEMTEESGDIWAEYGRIGDENGRWGRRRVNDPYPSFFWWPLYYEKITKRYEDTTADYEGEKITAKTESKPKDKDGKRNVVADQLFSKLAGYANDYLNQNLSEKNYVPTKQQIKDAKYHLYQLKNRKTVNGFNRQLAKLMMIVPRKVGKTELAVANSEDDFESIIEREQDLIDALESMDVKDSTDSFHDEGIYVHLAKDWQKQRVMRNLDASLVGHVKNVYHISYSDEKKARFDQFVEDKSATIKTVWHGTTNNNVLSILVNGLKTSASGAYCMFGQGIYFAVGKDGSVKSNGYNSHNGSFWRNGSDSTSYLILCKIAYKPHMATCVSDVSDYTTADMERYGTTCVHATTGAGLRHEEICLYYDEGVMITDLVELG